MIEVGAVPVRVGDAVVRAGGDEELMGAIGRKWCGVVEVVLIEREAALEPAGYRGMSLLPRSPFAEWPNGGQIVACGEFFQQQIGKGRCGFADYDARVPAALDENDGVAEAVGDHGEQRAAES